MRSRLIIVGSLLISFACGQVDEADLRKALWNQSATEGLALVSPIPVIVVVPFDGPERYFDSEHRSPITAFGKAGRMVLWWVSSGFLDVQGEILLDSIDGQNLVKRRPPVFGFHPIALREAGRRIAFWGKPEGAAGKGLYWAPFDFSSIRFIDNPTGDPDWSPDGRALVYEKKGQVYVFDVSNGKSKSLVAGHDPTWSPNGKWIAFVGLNGRASLVTTEGAPVDSPISTHQSLSALRWSPDGHYISFTEALPTALGLFDPVSQLLVCRVSDGAKMAVQKFNGEAVNYRNFHWIVEYRKFCGRCKRRP